MYHSWVLKREKLNDTDRRISKWVELTENTFNFACYARHWFEHGDKLQKRSILQGICSNLILQDKIVRVDDESPVQFIEEAKKKEPTISAMFEHAKETDAAPQIELLWNQNPTLLHSSPNVLYQLFPRDLVAQVKVQLEVLKELLDSESKYQVIEATNGRFCKLPIPNAS